jgi:eukaryotic-like serine/threonine-protein kinase
MSGWGEGVSSWNRSQWPQLSAYLDQALELAPEERGGWLASLQARDAGLAGELAELLRTGEEVHREGFLEGSPAPLLEQSSLAGMTVGAYTLQAPIGEGGMGSVWLASRSDGRYDAKVAIKLLKLALIGHAGEERFRREGQLLARLTHPNIARLIDAGVAPGGQPYLVLEHIEGEPIDRYCEAAGLDVTQRVRLLLHVLSATAHAHANLIVHRDIKPGNVLVSRQGQVKLLDFGIAKLLEEQPHASELTLEAHRVLTPEYCAPEQLLGEPVTTATDVYALGVLLYLLLCGQHPAGAATGSPAQMVKAVLDQVPRRISEVADSTRLKRTLRGDLDNIVAKALKKRPVERYLSVNELADDLQRYLAHEPVSAHADSVAYRVAKFVRRNRTAVGLGALAAIGLLAGMTGTLLQGRRAIQQAAVAEAQRARADREAHNAQMQLDFALRAAARADALNELDSFLLADAGPSGKPFTATDLLERAEHAINRQNADSLENRIELMVAIGRQYDIFEDSKRSLSALSAAYDLSHQVTDRSVRAKAACALADTLRYQGEFARGEQLVNDALITLADEPQFAPDRIGCLLRASSLERESGQVSLAIARVEAAQKLLPEVRYASAVLRTRIQMDLAESYRMAGRHADADRTFQQAFDSLAALGREHTETAGTLLNNWGLTRSFMGRTLEAAALFRRAIDIGSADRSEAHVAPVLLANYARALADLGRFAEAAVYAERAYTIAKRSSDEIIVNQTLLLRAGIYRQQHEVARARAALAEVAPRIERMYPPGHIARFALLREQARTAHAAGDLANAISLINRSLQLAQQSEQGRDAVPRAKLWRAEIELDMGRFEDARVDAQSAHDLFLQTVEPGFPSAFLGSIELTLGRALQSQGKDAQARAAFTAAVEQLRPAIGDDAPTTRTAERLLRALSRASP